MSELKFDTVLSPQNEQVFSGTPEETYGWLNQRENHWAVNHYVRIGETNQVIPVTRYIGRGLRYEAVLLLVKDAMRWQKEALQGGDPSTVGPYSEKTARKILEIFPEG
jgi:hypothetical protein